MSQQKASTSIIRASYYFSLDCKHYSRFIFFCLVEREDIGYWKATPFPSEETHRGADRHGCAQKSCQIQGQGRSSGETAYPIYSRNVTGHPRGQGSLDTNGTALNQTVCVCLQHSLVISPFIRQPVSSCCMIMPQDCINITALCDQIGWRLGLYLPN